MTASSSGVPRVGLVGYGGAGRAFHAPLLAAAGLDVAVVVTANPERAVQVRTDLPAAAVVPDLTTLLAVGLAKGPERKEPLVKLLATDPKRVLLTLLGPGGEPIDRHRDVQTQFAHVRLPRLAVT